MAVIVIVVIVVLAHVRPAAFYRRQPAASAPRRWEHGSGSGNTSSTTSGSVSATASRRWACVPRLPEDDRMQKLRDILGALTDGLDIP
jgi:hypothetical protein